MKSKVLSMCLSLFVSVCIWLYVTNVVSPESSEVFRDIPVQLQSVSLLEERGLVVTSVANPAITLTLTGNRTDLVKLSSENIRVMADVSKIYTPGIHELTYTEAFPGTVSGGAIEVKSRSADTIRITVEEKSSKKLNVEVEYIGAVPQGYLTDEAKIQLSTKTVNISGPQSLVDTVASAKITLDLTGCTETISKNYPCRLEDSAGNVISSSNIRMDASFIYVNLQIRKLKEVPVTFDVIYGGGATESNTTVKASMQTIQISGHKNVVKDIAEVYLGEIYLAELTKDCVVTLPIQLSSDVRNETGTHSVNVEITFSGLVTKKLVATNIKAINLPEGMKAVFVDKELPVTIRGTKEILDDIDASRITVVVDFSTTREGTSTMPAEIVIGGVDASTVGAIGSYTLIADMRRSE